jgi:hypothetical protein
MTLGFGLGLGLGLGLGFAAAPGMAGTSCILLLSMSSVESRGLRLLGGVGGRSAGGPLAPLDLLTKPAFSLPPSNRDIRDVVGGIGLVSSSSAFALALAAEEDVSLLLLSRLPARLTTLGRVGASTWVPAAAAAGAGG